MRSRGIVGTDRRLAADRIRLVSLAARAGDKSAAYVHVVLWCPQMALLVADVLESDGRLDSLTALAEAILDGTES